MIVSIIHSLLPVIVLCRTSRFHSFCFHMRKEGRKGVVSCYTYPNIQLITSQSTQYSALSIIEDTKHN